LYVLENKDTEQFSLLATQRNEVTMNCETVEMYFHANACGVTDKDMSRILNVGRSCLWELRKNGTANVEMACVRA